MTTELKPCPFCGKPAELEIDGDHRGIFFTLGCPDGDCAGRWVYYTQDIEEKDAAVERWNRRAA